VLPLKRFLGLFVIWFAGFCFVILKYGIQASFALAVPNLLIICSLAIPLFFLLSQIWETRVQNESAIVFFLLLFSVSLRLIVPLTDGTSTFVALRDPIYNFQLTNIYSEYGHWVWGLETGRAFDSLFTPALHLFSVSMSNITGIDLYNICRFIPPILFTLIVLLLVFCAFRRVIGSQKAFLACFIFAICYKYNTFSSIYHPESLGIVYFVMALYALVSMKSESGSAARKYTMLFILSSALLASTHFLSSFIFLVTITLIFFAGKIFRFSVVGRSSITGVDFLVFVTLMYAWIFFVTYHLFILQTNYISRYFTELLEIIANPWAPRSVQGVQEAGLPLWQSMIAYGGILIHMVFTLLTCFNLFIRRRSSANQATYWHRAFAVASVVLTGVTALGLFAIVQNQDVAYRFITFMYVFLAPTAAISFIGIQGSSEQTGVSSINSLRHRGGLWTRRMSIALLIIPVLSTGLLFPSFVGQPITFDDREIVVTSKWFSSYVNEPATILGEITLGDPIAVLARLNFWREAESNQYITDEFFLTVIDAIYYGGNMSYVLEYIQQRNATTLLILDKQFIDHGHFLLHANTRARVPSVDTVNSSFEILEQSPLLNRIYEGEAPRVYIASTGK